MVNVALVEQFPCKPIVAPAEKLELFTGCRAVEVRFHAAFANDENTNKENIISGNETAILN